MADIRELGYNPAELINKTDGEEGIDLKELIESNKPYNVEEVVNKLEEEV